MNTPFVSDHCPECCTPSEYVRSFTTDLGVTHIFECFNPECDLVRADAPQFTYTPALVRDPFIGLPS